MDGVFINIVNSIIALIIFLSNLYYFFSVKTIWRWIKLAYAINGCIFFIVSSLKIFGIYATEILNMMLLATILGGTMVSFAKINIEQYYYKKTIQTHFQETIEKKYLPNKG